MVALMTQRLDVQPDHKVLELGTGSGYQTAILGRLAGEVYSIERVKPLLDEAFERLLALGVRNVHFRHGDGTLGWPEAAPFDRILIAAGAPELPQKLLLDAAQGRRPRRAAGRARRTSRCSSTVRARRRRSWRRPTSAPAGS